MHERGEAREVVALVGNPALASRTRSVAELVAAGWTAGDHGVRTLELAAVAGSLFSAAAPDLDEARAAVVAADALVVATPAYKGSYTGLLKAFLDRLPVACLEDTVVVPVVLSGSSEHGALTDVHLRLVLGELGAVLPTPSFVIEEEHLGEIVEYVDSWHERHGAILAAAARSLHEQIGALS